MADYAVDFCKLVAESAWNPESLFDTFLQGLSEVVKDELAAWELPLDLNSLIAFTIRIDGRLRERRSERRSGRGHTRSSAKACSLQRNPEVREGWFSERIRSHPGSLENHWRWVSQILQNLCNWAELGYRLGNIHIG